MAKVGAKTVAPKKEKVDPFIRVYVSLRGNQILVDRGTQIDHHDGILTVEDDNGYSVAMFKEWDFARIEELQPLEFEDKE